MAKKKPLIVLAFSPSGGFDYLEEVDKEKRKIELLTEKIPNLVDVRILPNAKLQDLQDAFVNDGDRVLFFYYSGHSDKKALRVEVDEEQEDKYIDSVRLANLVKGNDTPPSIVFLNSCDSAAHVSYLLSVGVKSVVATSVSVDEEPAARIGTIFYKTFFTKNYTLQNAFKQAETTVGVKTTDRAKTNNSLVKIVAAHELDKTTKLIAEWNLFINVAHPEVINWKLEDFVKEFQQKK